MEPTTTEPPRLRYPHRGVGDLVPEPTSAQPLRASKGFHRRCAHMALIHAMDESLSRTVIEDLYRYAQVHATLALSADEPPE